MDSDTLVSGANRSPSVSKYKDEHCKASVEGGVESLNGRNRVDGSGHCRTYLSVDMSRFKSATKRLIDDGRSLLEMGSGHSGCHGN